MPNVAADGMQGCTDHMTMDRKCMSLFLIFEAFKEIIIFISGFLVLNYDDSFEFVCRLECTCLGNYLGHSEHFQFFTLLSSPERAQDELLWSIIVRRLSIWLAIRASVRPWTITWKIFSSETDQRFQWNFIEKILGWCTFGILQRYEFHEELYMATERKNFKNLLVPNRNG